MISYPLIAKDQANATAGLPFASNSSQNASASGSRPVQRNSVVQLDGPNDSSDDDDDDDDSVDNYDERDENDEEENDNENDFAGEEEVYGATFYLKININSFI